MFMSIFHVHIFRRKWQVWLHLFQIRVLPKLPIFLDFVYFAQNTIQENSFLPSVKNIRETGKSTRQITLGKKHVDKNYFPSEFRPELGILFAKCIYACLKKKRLDEQQHKRNATCHRIQVYFHAHGNMSKHLPSVFPHTHSTI